MGGATRLSVVGLAHLSRLLQTVMMVTSGTLCLWQNCGFIVQLLSLSWSCGNNLNIQDVKIEICLWCFDEIPMTPMHSFIHSWTVVLKRDYFMLTFGDALLLIFIVSVKM
ncbi:hypothetical protein T11_14101 [Trichinella zimbabwensis]|uniref:Uncharacterized protein n=1 Tax=Trichinella zimbabwensis TaxID=268475 RepID=A0A0V1GUP8_9BILA|nr:hypothetical protein T11_14101 [Trichinella zimbabwensis]